MPLFSFPIAQMVKNLLAMQETWVQSLGQEDPLEREMAIHSSTLAWRIPWTEEPTVYGATKSQTPLSDEHTHIWGFPGGTSGKEPTYRCR